jgi:hypothetical protein
MFDVFMHLIIAEDVAESSRKDRCCYLWTKKNNTEIYFVPSKALKLSKLSNNFDVPFCFVTTVPLYPTGPESGSALITQDVVCCMDRGARLGSRLNKYLRHE